MVLKLKDKYKDTIIQNSRFGKLELSAVPSSLYNYYYDTGLSEFFEEVKEKKVKKTKNDDIDDSYKDLI